jgi:hypothetical protein
MAPADLRKGLQIPNIRNAGAPGSHPGGRRFESG